MRWRCSRRWSARVFAMSWSGPWRWLPMEWFGRRVMWTSSWLLTRRTSHGLRAALRSVFDDPSIDEIDAEELAGAYPVVQYFPPDEAYSVDIIARLGEALAYEDIEWHWMEIDGLRIKVA